MTYLCRKTRTYGKILNSVLKLKTQSYSHTALKYHATKLVLLYVIVTVNKINIFVICTLYRDKKHCTNVPFRVT